MLVMSGVVVIVVGFRVFVAVAATRMQCPQACICALSVVTKRRQSKNIQVESQRKKYKKAHTHTQMNIRTPKNKLNLPPLILKVSEQPATNKGTHPYM